jgi:hypothetical protein
LELLAEPTARTDLGVLARRMDGLLVSALSAAPGAVTDVVLARGVEGEDGRSRLQGGAVILTADPP